MTTLKALVVVLAVLAATAVAQETRDAKWHGLCLVYTEADPMSDEVGAGFFCKGESEEEPLLYIAKRVGSSTFTVGVGSKTTERVADNTPLDELQAFAPSEVRYRVDDGDILTRSANVAADGVFYVAEDALAEALLEQVPKGEKFHFAIENFRTYTILLHGAKEAVADFQERLAPTLGGGTQ